MADDKFDLNQAIVNAYTKFCKTHKTRFDVIIGCPGCLADQMKRLFSPRS